MPWRWMRSAHQEEPDNWPVDQEEAASCWRATTWCTDVSPSDSDDSGSAHNCPRRVASRSSLCKSYGRCWTRTIKQTWPRRSGTPCSLSQTNVSRTMCLSAGSSTSAHHSVVRARLSACVEQSSLKQIRLIRYFWSVSALIWYCAAYCSCPK